MSLFQYEYFSTVTELYLVTFTLWCCSCQCVNSEPETICNLCVSVAVCPLKTPEERTALGRAVGSLTSVYRSAICSQTSPSSAHQEDLSLHTAGPQTTLLSTIHTEEL